LALQHHSDKQATSSKGTTALQTWTKAAMALLALSLGVAAALSSSKLVFGLFVLLGLGAAVAKPIARRERMLAIGVSMSHIGMWFLLAKLSQSGGHEFFGANRLLTPLADPTGSRIELWSEILILIKDSPWLGSGFGRLNEHHFWATLPHRLTLDLTHAHNLPLHFAAEFGIPFAAIWLLILIYGLILWLGSLGRTWWRTWPLLAVLFIFAADGAVDWPFWYTYFLAPASGVLGVLVGMGSNINDIKQASVNNSNASQKITAIGCALVLFLAWDFHYVIPLFSRGGGEVMQKIEYAYKTILFQHYVDYGVVTNTPVTKENYEKHEALTVKVSKFRLDQRVAEALLMAALWKNDQQRIDLLATKLEQADEDWAHHFLLKSKDPEIESRFNSYLHSK
jgi:hypothetical protein